METARESADVGVKQVADQLHERLRDYLESQYHIRNADVIAERRSLLEEVGTIGQQPYLETTPTYELGTPYAQLGLPDPLGEVLSVMSEWQPSVGVYPRPYVHQAEALESFFNEGRDLIVATGTGSGKTETFLLPILGQLLLEASQRAASFQYHGCRALLLYPMNALVSDQLGRLRRLFGDERLSELFRQLGGRHPRFGSYTSRTPYPGPRTSKKDRRHLDQVLRYYLEIEYPPSDRDEDEKAVLKRRYHELRERGRWPAKDLAGFFGEPGRRWETRLRTQPGDSELMTRHEIQEQCPDILVTNYSMLEYMLLRPIERSIFRQTRQWLEQDKRNQFVLVLDEAHMYRGAGGAEVGFLLRRLQSRLGIPRERMRCILTSASLGSGAAESAAKTFAVGLTGHPPTNPMPFTLIRGQREVRPTPRPGTTAEAVQFASFDLTTFASRAEERRSANHAVANLAQRCGWPPLPTALSQVEGTQAPSVHDVLQRYLYDQLDGFGPIELLIQATASNATGFQELARLLFPEAEVGVAERATDTLLALGTFARRGERPLLPTRVHLFYRGLPSLYACLNPCCDQRRNRPGEELLLGRLYTEPRTHCSCSAQARVYELYTHRDCGAAFLHVFGDGPTADFYWHEQGGKIENIGEKLTETFLLVEEPHGDTRSLVEPIWLELTTGRVQREAPNNLTGYRLVYRPAFRPDAHDHDSGAVSFATCPVCTKGTGDKIMDLATKGEQPFANLVREQFLLQPASKPLSEQYPNGGRKVLLFSDGRQKAARLARDLPREVEFDSLRQVLALAVDRLDQLDTEATLDSRLYAAFVSCCRDFHLHFFDAESQRHLIHDIQRFRRDYDHDLELALDEDWDRQLNAPPGYQRGLLRQLSDPYYSLYAACAAVVQPTKSTLRRLQRDLTGLPANVDEVTLEAITTAWIQMLLERSAFDMQINEDTRRDVNEYFRPLKWNNPISRFEKLLERSVGLSTSQIKHLREQLYARLCQESEGNAFLLPAVLRLNLTLEAPWYQCSACKLLQYAPVAGCCVYCGANQIEMCPPDHPYLAARKGYFQRPLRAVLAGERPIHMTAEEHTAQLSQRDVGIVYATTEEYELRFQDVPLGPDKPPVDVLSCTTTMEVGIDIGSLSAIGLRNVPPQRENYQQRAGRAGRRGTAVSTVVSYAQGGPHDNYYYQHPEEIISGEPREPKVKVDNRRLARRHVHSFLIQTFFHNQLDQLSDEDQRQIAEQRTHLMSAFGLAVDFFSGQGPFSLVAFRRFIEEHVLRQSSNLSAQVAHWLPDEICALSADPIARLAEKQAFVAEVAEDFMQSLAQLAGEYQATGVTNGADSQKHADDEDDSTALLLDILFDHGLLPSYAFPTDLCAFYVFEEDGDQVHIKERPQQAKDRALSEYAPGRLLVINKETYRVGGIHLEGTNSGSPVASLFVGDLNSYVYCPTCTYVREEPLQQPGELCPICSDGLLQRQMIDPPGFSPERGKPLRERDREQEISYATAAQFPTPLAPDRFDWKASLGHHLRYTYEEGRRLVVVNKGPDSEGFAICESCGAAWPENDSPARDDHPRPFLIPWHVLNREGLGRRCHGTIRHDLYLGHSFVTDLLLLQFEIGAPLGYDARHAWLHDALRTAAEAASLAVSRRLDIDPGELSAGYRLIPAHESEHAGVLGLAELYLFDTASGGAGYAAEAGDILPEILDGTLELLRHCPADCERSCTRCLRHYGNRYWHERLDRHLANQLLTYAVHARIPQSVAAAHAARQLAPLHRYLELEGWASRMDAMINEVEIPLLVELGSGRYAALSTYPALLDPNAAEFVHPLQKLDSVDQVSVVLLRDYVVSRDLPTAYQEFRSSIRGQY